MKPLLLIALLATSICLVKACADTTECSKEFYQINTKIETAIDSCYEIQSTSTENISTDISNFVQILVEVKESFEFYSSEMITLNQNEVQILSSNLISLEIGIRESVHQINNCKQEMNQNEINTEFIDEAYYQMYFNLDFSFNQMVEICPINWKWNIIPTCNRIRKVTKKHCSYDKCKF